MRRPSNCGACPTWTITGAELLSCSLLPLLVLLLLLLQALLNANITQLSSLRFGDSKTLPNVDVLLQPGYDSLVKRLLPGLPVSYNTSGWHHVVMHQTCTAAGCDTSRLWPSQQPPAMPLEGSMLLAAEGTAASCMRGTAARKLTRPSPLVHAAQVQFLTTISML